ncbi:MAG TPA: hypothetical protein VGL66_09045 [Caulobacteraceae bacterium]|jgi:tetratricopeptide (TPR) repeat protein
MRIRGLLILTLMAAATAFSAHATGPTQNPMTGSPISYPNGRVDTGGHGQWAGTVDEYNNGLTALKAKKYRDAIIDFNHALGGAPRDPNVWIMLGVAKEGAGDLRGAHGAFAKAVKFDDGNIAARGRLGATAAELGLTDEAQAQLADLQTRAAACGAGCPDQAPLKDAITAIQDALAHGPAKS